MPATLSQSSRVPPAKNKPAFLGKTTTYGSLPLFSAKQQVACSLAFSLRRLLSRSRKRTLRTRWPPACPHPCLSAPHFCLLGPPLLCATPPRRCWLPLHPLPPVMVAAGAAAAESRRTFGNTMRTSRFCRRWTCFRGRGDHPLLLLRRDRQRRRASSSNSTSTSSNGGGSSSRTDCPHLARTRKTSPLLILLLLLRWRWFATQLPQLSVLRSLAEQQQSVSVATAAPPCSQEHQQRHQHQRQRQGVMLHFLQKRVVVCATQKRFS